MGGGEHDLDLALRVEDGIAVLSVNHPPVNALSQVVRQGLLEGMQAAKARPELKAQESKSQTWGFKGEIWEDEIGHYRSSLKNVCPKDDQIASY